VKSAKRSWARFTVHHRGAGPDRRVHPTRTRSGRETRRVVVRAAAEDGPAEASLQRPESAPQRRRPRVASDRLAAIRGSSLIIPNYSAHNAKILVAFQGWCSPISM
jgi:hypothetical protein